MANEDTTAIIHEAHALVPLVQLMLQELLVDHPRSSHIAMIVLMHTLVRTEVQGRMKGQSNDFYRAIMHTILDETFDHEERRAAALK